MIWGCSVVHLGRTTPRFKNFDNLQNLYMPTNIGRIRVLNGLSPSILTYRVILSGENSPVGYFRSRTPRYSGGGCAADGISKQV